MRRCSTGKGRGWRIPQKRCASSGRAFRRSSRFRPSQAKTNPLPTSAVPSTAARWGSNPAVFGIVMSFIANTKGAMHMFVVGQLFCPNTTRCGAAGGSFQGEGCSAQAARGGGATIGVPQRSIEFETRHMFAQVAASREEVAAHGAHEVVVPLSACPNSCSYEGGCVQAKSGQHKPFCSCLATLQVRPCHFPQFLFPFSLFPMRCHVCGAAQLTNVGRRTVAGAGGCTTCSVPLHSCRHVASCPPSLLL